MQCALGWACWKTYLGRPETDSAYAGALQVLGNGLHDAYHYEDALTVKEAELSMLRRVGAHEQNILAVQTNLANVYQALGRLEHSLQLERDVYHGSVRLLGEEHRDTLISVNNLAATLFKLKRFEEAKSLIHITTPVARRVLGESHDLTLKMRKTYAQSLCEGPSATLDDLRQGMTTLEEIERIARRVFGGAHPFTAETEQNLQVIRAALRARETLAEAMASTTLGDA